MPYGNSCGPCRMTWCLLIILALIFSFGTMYETNIDSGKTYNNETVYIWTDLWLGFLLLAIFFAVGLISDCMFDDRQFVFDPNFGHWAVKTGNDKAF
mmetsp:Transcript_4082/g.3549  ORF Transcript_4082/g.3549 Transcript_4082/m.3549 type:complete len:97 (+) Transcript_4082:68-358(+)